MRGRKQIFREALSLLLDKGFISVVLIATMTIKSPNYICHNKTTLKNSLKQCPNDAKTCIYAH